MENAIFSDRVRSLPLFSGLAEQDRDILLKGGITVEGSQVMIRDIRRM